MDKNINPLIAKSQDLFKSIKDTKTEYHFLLELNFLFDEEQLRCYEAEVIDIFHKVVNQEKGIFETIDPNPSSSNLNAWKLKNWKTSHDIYINPLCLDLASLWKTRAASKLPHYWINFQNLGMILDMEGIPWVDDFMKPQILFGNIFDKLNYKFLFMYFDINIDCYVSSNDQIEQYIPGLESEYHMRWSYNSEDELVLEAPQGMDGNSTFQNLDADSPIQPSKIKLA